MVRALFSFVTLVCAIAMASPLAGGQSPTFEVASIKPNRTTGGGFTNFAVRPGGRFIATNTSLRDLIAYAYQLFSFQLEGAPSWADTDRYDINAKSDDELRAPDANITNDDTPPVLLMIRALLAERFKLTVRTEMREMSRYALVLVRPGRLGPRLTASTVDCVAIRAERSRSIRAAGAVPLPPPPPAAGNVLPCSAGSASGYHAGNGMVLSSLVRSLSRVVDRTVVDETGLTGPFDWSLEYQPEGGRDGTAALGDKPSLIAALQEQLGLKLESRRGPVQMVIIERVERPTPD